MNEQLISLETAKLAKEKGFDRIKIVSKNNIEAAYNAPTQSLLQKWLREVHKIHLVCWWYDKKDKFYTELGSKANGVTRVQTGNTTNLFDSYEEALEAGLLNALQLIK